MKAIAILLCLLLVACATTTSIRSDATRKITQSEQQLNATARDFIATASNILAQVNTRKSDSQLQQAIDIIKKSQVLLRGSVDDGVDYNTQDAAKLQRQIQAAYDKNRELVDRIEHLETLRDTTADVLAAKDIAHQAVERKEFWDRFKWYSVVMVLLSSIVAIFVYVPVSAVRKLLGLLGTK